MRRRRRGRKGPGVMLVRRMPGDSGAGGLTGDRELRERLAGGRRCRGRRNALNTFQARGQDSWRTERLREEQRLSPEGPRGAFVLGELCVRKRPQDACRRSREQGPPDVPEPGKRVSEGGREKIRALPMRLRERLIPSHHHLSRGSRGIPGGASSVYGVFRELRSSPRGEPVGIPEGGPVRSGAAPGGELRLSHLRNWLRAERGWPCAG